MGKTSNRPSNSDNQTPFIASPIPRKQIAPIEPFKPNNQIIKKLHQMTPKLLRLIVEMNKVKTGVAPNQPK